MYGGPVTHFRGRRQFLRAFRDAIAGAWLSPMPYPLSLDDQLMLFCSSGYESLASKGVLHRDISAGNIQLGKRGALRGNKGILIDLDIGTEVDREGLSKDPRIVCY